MKYGKVFVAGTFDGIHKGHESLLTRAFEVGEKVTIGLTSDEFVEKFRIQNSEFRIQTHEERKKVLEQWLEKHNKRASIISIDDPYEPAASLTHLDALVVSTQTKARGVEINDMRIKRGLSPLKLIEVPMVPAEDGSSVSSTRIRNGEIDRDGRLIMPENMRDELAKPLGTVLVGKNIDVSIHRYTSNIIITVGDVATKTLLDCGVKPALSIVDFRVGRKPSNILASYKNSIVLHSTKVKSGPGFISKKAMQVVKVVFATQARPVTPVTPARNQIILVDGEEDLLALPAIQYAPIGSVVYYGQPGEGLVEVVITKEKKNQVLEILSKFS